MVRIASLHLPQSYVRDMSRHEYGTLFGGYSEAPRYQGSQIGYTSAEATRREYERERKKKWRERQRSKRRKQPGEKSKKIINPFL